MTTEAAQWIKQRRDLLAGFSHPFQCKSFDYVGMAILAKGDLPKALAMLEAVLALHTPSEVYANADECECGNEEHAVIESFSGEMLCWDSPTGDRYCDECVDETGDELPAWPCRTVAAIEALL